jgi:AsmA protein
MKRKRLLVIAGIIALIIIGLIVVPFIIDVNTYRPKAEAVLSDALGMDVKIKGDMHVVLLPDFRVSLNDVSIRGVDNDFCIVKKTKIDLELMSVIHDEVNIFEIDLSEPAFNIVRDKDGIFNFEKPGEPSSINLPYIEKFAISNGKLIYLDEKNEDRITISGIDLELADVSVDKSADKTLIQTISFDGTVKAEQLESKEYEVSKINYDVKAREGVFEVRSKSKGTVVQQDEQTKDKVIANNIDLALADISVDENSEQDFIRRISCNGTVKVEKMKSEDYVISKLDLRAKARKGVFELHSVSKTDVVFFDEKSDDKVYVEGLNFALENLSIDESGDKDLIKKISFEGDVSIERFEEENYEFSDLSFRTKARNGIFELRSISTSNVHGKEDDRIIIDLNGTIPAFKIKYTESGLSAEEMLRRLSQEEEVLKGAVDLAINLSMKGTSLDEIKRTLNGDITFKGENLIFHGLDIDDVISKFERSQQFDLLDVGSTFFLGPFGPAITKGSEFAQVYSALQKEKDSEIQQLICSWDIENGIAEAQDVALATKKYRVAMIGKLDLVNEQFLDVTMAVLDSKGCAVVSQEMHGSFSNPEIKTMNTIQALMGPVMGVLNDTTKVLFRRKCKVFYKGSLEHPKVMKKGLFKKS